MDNLKKPKSKERILVTGAGGFIGSHLVEYLLKNGKSVICLVRPGENLRWLEGLDIKLVYADITNKSSLNQAFEKVSYIYHLAARMGGGDNSSYVMRINFDGTKNLVDLCISKNLHLKRFLFVSSVAAMGPTGASKIFDEQSKANPDSEYGKSKLSAEGYLAANKDKITYSIVRLPLVYGPRSGRGLYVLFKLAEKRIQLKIKNNFTTVGFITDIIKQMFLVATSPRTIGETYILGENKIYSSYEIIEYITRAAKKRTVKIKLPYWMLYSVTCILEFFFDLIGVSPPIRRHSLKSYLNTNWRFRTDKICSINGDITKYPLSEGIKITYLWYKKNNFL